MIKLLFCLSIPRYRHLFNQSSISLRYSISFIIITTRWKIVSRFLSPGNYKKSRRRVWRVTTGLELDRSLIRVVPLSPVPRNRHRPWPRTTQESGSRKRSQGHFHSLLAKWYHFPRGWGLSSSVSCGTAALSLHRVRVPWLKDRYTPRKWTIRDKSHCW